MDSVEPTAHIERRDRRAAKTLAVALSVNSVIAIAKIVMGVFSGSVSILADGFDSLLDALSEIIGLIAVFFTAQPADLDHPYGHRKAETLGTLSIAILMFVAAALIVRNGVVALVEGTGPEIGWLSFAVMGVALLAKGGLVLWQRVQSRDLDSDLLLADFMQTRNDVLVAAAVIVGLIATTAGFVWVDAVLGLVVAGVVVAGGIKVIRTASWVLLDSTSVDPKLIEYVAKSIPEVKDCHAVRTRGRPSEMFMDLHVMVDPELTVLEGHRVSHEVANLMRSEIPGVKDVVVHLEPHSATVDVAGDPRRASQQ